VEAARLGDYMRHDQEESCHAVLTKLLEIWEPSAELRQFFRHKFKELADEQSWDRKQLRQNHKKLAGFEWQLMARSALRAEETTHWLRVYHVFFGGNPLDHSLNKYGRWTWVARESVLSQLKDFLVASVDQEAEQAVSA
jgi:hypothetical protein